MSKSVCVRLIVPDAEPVSPKRGAGFSVRLYKRESVSCSTESQRDSRLKEKFLENFSEKPLTRYCYRGRMKILKETINPTAES